VYVSSKLFLLLDDELFAFPFALTGPDALNLFPFGEFFGGDWDRGTDCGVAAVFSVEGELWLQPIKKLLMKLMVN
jgi:hypothetical protein